MQAFMLGLGWSPRHLSIDAPTAAGSGSYAAEGVPVPLWQLVFHEDVGFAEMTAHEMLSADRSMQECTSDGDLEVEVNKGRDSRTVSAGKARTGGVRKL